MLWRKVVTPAAAISLLWLAIGGATICYLAWVYRSHARDVTETFTAIQASDAMLDALWRLQATVIEVAELADNHTRIEVAELEGAFERHLADADASTVSPEARALVQSIREQFTGYQQHIHRRLDSSSPAGPDRAPLMELSRSAHTIAESCKSLLEVQERLIAESIAQRGWLRMAFGRVMLTLWIVGPVVGIVLGLWIARRLRHSIAQISISLKDAAGGLEREVGRVAVGPSDDLPALHEQVQQVSSRIRQVVDELQEARRETMLADRLAAVGEMAAGVAHELRNPLTAVKLLIQAAEGPAGQTLTAEHIHIVLEQVVRMENTIQGLLDFARPPPMQKAHHDLRDTLQRARNLVEGYARQQGVVIAEAFPDHAVLVDGDPEQLHQVFVNLLLNGVEAMPDGGELQVAVDCGNGTSPVCRISFRDRGTGIPDAVMERIFEPFVTSKQRGTGLGLAISRRIVQQHGGKLMAANREPCGAVFTVELPLSFRSNGAHAELEATDVEVACHR